MGEAAIWQECPHLGRPVEVTAERQSHLAAAHPDLWPLHRAHVLATLRDPDRVACRPGIADELVFSRWYDDVLRGKHVVAVIRRDPSGRWWLVTAFSARRLAQRELLWKRDA